MKSGKAAGGRPRDWGGMDRPWSSICTLLYVVGEIIRESRMAEKIGGAFQAEQKRVADLLEDAFAGLPEALSQFVRSEMEEEQILAGVVLASAAPEDDSNERKERRVALAAALELLQVALNIHRLLLRPERNDTIDNVLLGGTILAGDYCFSRAAVLAARTCHPGVVTVFAELLQTLSESNLRRVIARDGASYESMAAAERAALFESGAAAGGMLADLAEDEMKDVAAYAAEVSQAGAMVSTGVRDKAARGKLDRLPLRQRARWGQLVARISYDGNRG